MVACHISGSSSDHISPARGGYYNSDSQMYEYLIPELINCMFNIDYTGIGMHCLVWWGCFSNFSCVRNNIAKIWNNINHIYSENFKMKQDVHVPKAWQSFSLTFSQEIRYVQYTHFERMSWRARKTLVKHPPAFITTQFFLRESFEEI